MTADELDGIRAFVRDFDCVEEKPEVVQGLGMSWSVARYYVNSYTVGDRFRRVCTGSLGLGHT